MAFDAGTIADIRITPIKQKNTDINLLFEIRRDEVEAEDGDTGKTKRLYNNIYDNRKQSYDQMGKPKDKQHSEK